MKRLQKKEPSKVKLEKKNKCDFKILRFSIQQFIFFKRTVQRMTHANNKLYYLLTLLPFCMMT